MDPKVRATFQHYGLQTLSQLANAFDTRLEPYAVRDSRGRVSTVATTTASPPLSPTTTTTPTTSSATKEQQQQQRYACLIHEEAQLRASLFEKVAVVEHQLSSRTLLADDALIALQTLPRSTLEVLLLAALSSSSSSSSPAPHHAPSASPTPTHASVQESNEEQSQRPHSTTVANHPHQHHPFGPLLGPSFESIVQSVRARREAEHLPSPLPLTVRVCRSGVAEVVPRDDVQRGDLLLLHHGETVPCDALLLTAPFVHEEDAEALPVEEVEGIQRGLGPHKGGGGGILVRGERITGSLECIPRRPITSPYAVCTVFGCYSALAQQCEILLPHAKCTVMALAIRTPSESSWSCTAAPPAEGEDDESAVVVPTSEGDDVNSTQPHQAMMGSVSRRNPGVPGNHTSTSLLPATAAAGLSVRQRKRILHSLVTSLPLFLAPVPTVQQANRTALLQMHHSGVVLVECEPFLLVPGKYRVEAALLWGQQPVEGTSVDALLQAVPQEPSAASDDTEAARRLGGGGRGLFQHPKTGRGTTHRHPAAAAAGSGRALVISSLLSYSGSEDHSSSTAAKGTSSHNNKAAVVVASRYVPTLSQHDRMLPLLVGAMLAAWPPLQREPPRSSEPPSSSARTNHQMASEAMHRLLFHSSSTSEAEEGRDLPSHATIHAALRMEQKGFQPLSDPVRIPLHSGCDVTARLFTYVKQPPPLPAAPFEGTRSAAASANIDGTPADDRTGHAVLVVYGPAPDVLSVSSFCATPKGQVRVSSGAPSSDPYLDQALHEVACSPDFVVGIATADILWNLIGTRIVPSPKDVAALLAQSTSLCYQGALVCLPELRPKVGQGLQALAAGEEDDGVARDTTTHSSPSLRKVTVVSFNRSGLRLQSLLRRAMLPVTSSSSSSSSSSEEGSCAAIVVVSPDALGRWRHSPAPPAPSISGLSLADCAVVQSTLRETVQQYCEWTMAARQTAADGRVSSTHSSVFSPPPPAQLHQEGHHESTGNPLRYMGGVSVIVTSLCGLHMLPVATTAVVWDRRRPRQDPQQKQQRHAPLRMATQDCYEDNDALSYGVLRQQCDIRLAPDGTLQDIATALHMADRFWSAHRHPSGFTAEVAVQ